MRLLLLITDLELGGTPIVVRELATRLRSENTHVEVACLKPIGIVGQQLQAAGVIVTSFAARHIWQLPRVVRALRRLVRAREIDTMLSLLVHANFAAHLAARKLPGVRFFQSIQTTQPGPAWHWRLQRVAAKSARRIVVPTESVARVARERSRIPACKLTVIPNAVDYEHFRRSNVAPVIATEPADAQTETFRVGFVGRLDPVKRVGDLIAAVATLEEFAFTLDIWGDGPQRAALEREILIQGYDICLTRFFFHGAITDARKAYATMDALVLPSDAEGFGLVLIEAMAAGVPVIGTDVDGIRDVIRNGETGLLVPPRDPKRLAAAIVRLRDDVALRGRLIENGLAEVRSRYGWDAVLKRYESLLSSAPRA